MENVCTCYCPDKALDCKFGGDVGALAIMLFVLLAVFHF